MFGVIAPFMVLDPVMVLAYVMVNQEADIVVADCPAMSFVFVC